MESRGQWAGSRICRKVCGSFGLGVRAFPAPEPEEESGEAGFLPGVSEVPARQGDLDWAGSAAGLGMVVHRP